MSKDKYSFHMIKQTKQQKSRLKVASIAITQNVCQVCKLDLKLKAISTAI